MLIGVVADIHDAVAPLKRALARFRQVGVDRVVTLGDAFNVCRRGSPAVDVARMLHGARAIGVWGNHDFGLSRGVTDELRHTAHPALLAFASQLNPSSWSRTAVFRVEHHLDPTNIADLWVYDELPNPQNANRCFRAVGEKFLFMGHHHQWLIIGSDGSFMRDIEQPVTLAPAERYLVVMGALVDGWCATFDSVTATLTPIRCDDSVDLKRALLALQLEDHRHGVFAFHVVGLDIRCLHGLGLSPTRNDRTRTSDHPYSTFTTLPSRQPAAAAIVSAFRRAARVAASRIRSRNPSRSLTSKSIEIDDSISSDAIAAKAVLRSSRSIGRSRRMSCRDRHPTK